MGEDEFRSACKAQLGKPYIWGGEGPDTFDCSGFAQWALSLIGLDKNGDQSADGLYRHFKKKEFGAPVESQSATILGDLVFYGKPKRVTHVVVAWGKGLMIEAGGGGSKTVTVELARKAKAEVRIRPISRRNDVVGIIRPIGIPWA